MQRPLEATAIFPILIFTALPVASDPRLVDRRHIANGNPENADLYRMAPAGRFAQFRVPTVTACFDVIMSELPKVFPKLRWGFIEASAQWVPWIYREAAIRYRAGGRAFPENVFEDYNIFVTCQVNDDVPYIVRCAGENRLVIGTDYGHTDPSSAVTALNEFQRMEGIDPAVKEKILSHNAKALTSVRSSCQALESARVVAQDFLDNFRRDIFIHANVGF